MLTSNTDGLKALHLLLVKARARACEKQDKELTEILDAAEVLPMYMLSDTNDTGLFISQLEGLGERFPEFSGIVQSALAQPIPSDAG